MKTVLMALLLFAGTAQASTLASADNTQAAASVASGVIAQGTFKPVDTKHSIRGNFRFEKRSNGLFLKLGSNFKTTKGPDLRLVLRDSTGKTPMVILAPLTKFRGSQKYQLALTETELSQFNELVVYCAEFHVDFGVGTL